jgi:hypothetical protein
MSLKDFERRVTHCIKALSNSADRVQSKFLADAIRGVLSAKSVLLADMARALRPRLRTTERHIFKRLDRNLGQTDLRPLKDRAQAQQIGRIDNDTFIYFDPSDVVKPYGHAFEALSKVADGSDDHTVKPGYPVSVCVALRGNELIPIEWDIGSWNAEDFESENQLLLSQIDTIFHRAHGRGTFVLDRGFDRYVIIRHLHELNNHFIIRMTKTRHYCPSDVPATRHAKTYPRQEIINRCATLSTRALLDIRIEKKRLVKRCFRIKAAPVRLPENIDNEQPLTLIRATCSGRLTLYLLTSLPDLTRETLVTIVEAYLNRWKVEEFIRFTKQQYKAEEFRVRSLGRIRNLHYILFLALVVLTRVSDYQNTLSPSRALLLRYARRIFPIPQKMRFFFYSLAEGLANVLEKTASCLARLWSPRPSRQLQLALTDAE